MNARRAAALAVVLAALAGCSSAVGGSGHRTSASPPASRSAAAPTAPPAAGASSAPAAKRRAPMPHVHTRPVHAGLFEADGHTYGVGMPIIVRFSRPVTDPRAFDRAVTVRVNGTPAHGVWDWEQSASSDWAVEAHYRSRHLWPAHSRITVDAPLKGRSAGRGLAFDDNLTLSMRIGAAHISTVDWSATSPHMTVTSDGRVVRTLPVSLGTSINPTYRGRKVVEEFDRIENMEGTPVPWSVRITNSGEFVHAAPWNSEIGRANLSHGCTNLATADAEWFYRFSRLGDVVDYPNAPGALMRATDGWGDWNVRWAKWRQGGTL